MDDPQTPDPNPIVFIRDRARALRLRQLDEWDALTLIGAVSSDPREMDELESAWRRYVPDACLEEGAVAMDDAQPQGPWLLMDLACQRLVAGGGFELPEHRAAFQRDEGEWNPEIPVVWINHPPHWRSVEDVDWEQAFEPIPPLSEPVDFRGVLYGRALAAGIAERTLKIASAQTLPSKAITWDDVYREDFTTDEQREAAGRWHELTVRVHADWLMTPRDDLGGEPPRPFLHRGREWVEHEMHNRQMQWSNQRQPPPGLEPTAFAYRHGPPGRDEVVIYFDLCREVIAEAWRVISTTPDVDETSLTDALHEHTKSWLKSGTIDGDPTPPAAIIESERRRMPLTGDMDFFFDDCPICRMLADADSEGFGPTFRGFDGHHLELDDEFAFSLCETREEWGKEQEEFRRMSEEMDAKHKKEPQEGATEESESAWASSYVAPGAPLTAMTLAFRLSEIVGDLQSTGGYQNQIEDLNAAFEACRDATADPVLLGAAKSRLVDMLEELAAAHAEWTPKIADFQSQLDEWSRNVKDRDEDIPF
jgi:hypothetical protein